MPKCWPIRPARALRAIATSSWATTPSTTSIWWPDDIIVTTGGSEALLFGFMATLNPGDEIIITEPAYANYMSFALMVGAKVRSIHTSIDNGFALPAVEEFEKLINANTRAILICNPNNPTGYVYTRQEMEQIRDIVKKHDLYLFADEVYREYIYTDEPYTSAMHLEGIENNVILVDSVSKRYSECGIRIDAIITKNTEVRKAVLKFCLRPVSLPPFDGSDHRRGLSGGSRELYRGRPEGVCGASQLPRQRS